MSQRITPSLIIEGIHIPFNGTSNDLSTPNHWSRNANSSAQVPTEGICSPFNGTSNNLSTPNQWSRNTYSSPQMPTGGIHIPFNGTSSDMSTPNQWSRNIYSSPQMSIEMGMLNYAQGIHIPFNGTFGDTSTPNSLAGQEIVGTISDLLAPITPERGARVTNHNLSTGPRSVLDGGLNNEKRQDESVPCLVCSATQVNQQINLCSSEEVSLSSTDILSTTQLKEVHSLREGEGLQGIDLNKTPQKSRRKKHRPKVVIEGKPQKTPKPVTPQQTIKKEKRKYVRKTPPKEKPVPSTHVGEVDESVGPRDTVRSSCRRFLNFNTEVQVAKGSSVDSGPTVLPVKTDPQFQLQDICEGSQNNILGLPNSNQKLSQGLEVVAETSTAGFAFDLNHSLSQMLGGYILLPLNPNPSPPIARIDLGKENTDITGRNRNMKSMPLRLHTATTDCTIIPTILPAPQYVARTQVNSNNNSHLRFANELPLGKGLKRNYCETIGPNHLDSMNLLGANLFSSNACQKINQDDNTHPSSTDKKITDVRPNEETMKVSSSVMGAAGCDAHTLQTSQSRGLPQCNYMEGKHKLHGISANYSYDGYSHPMTGPYNYTAPKFSHVFAFADSERRPLPQCNSLQEIHKLHSITSNYGYDGYSHPMTGPYNFIAPNYPHVITFTEAERRPFFNPMQDLEGIVSPIHSETQKKKRSKVPVSVCNLAPITAVTQVKQFPPSDGTKVSLKARESHSQGKLKIKKQAKKLPTNCAKSLSYYSSNQAGLQGDDVATCNNHQSFTESSDALGQKSFEPTSSSSQSRRAPKVPNHFVHSRKATAAPQAHRNVPFNDPIDEIIWRLKSMNISECETSEAQNKLVLYGGDKQMVPHEGPFDPFKKRQRPRPKVDLDEETNRVWRLLMWKEGSDEMGGMDAEKEKWWEEERRVFRGRTDSFIARMHLVQGDRRFSRWKGSVVDSVIGVFLTQNVSDHLSSSAFMALAARFPLLPRTNNGRPDPEGTSKSLDEPEVSILDFDNWQEKKLHKGVCNQGFMTLNEAQKTEEKEMASSIESLGSNMGPIGANYSTGKQIAVIDNGSESSRESPRDRTETPRVPQDMVSSQSSVVSSENSTDSKKQIVDQTLSSSESNSEAENTVIGPNSNGYYGCNFTSFMELLNMQGAHEFHEFNDQRNDIDIIPSNDSFEGAEFVMRRSKLGESLASTQPSTCQTKPHHNQTKEEFIEHRGSESYSEAEHTLTGPKSNEYDFGATSFMELLHMQGAHVFHELDTHRNDAVPSNVSFEGAEFEIRRSSLDGSLASTPPSTCQAKPHHIQTKGVFEDNGPVTAVDEVNIVEASADESKLCALSTTSEVAVTKSVSCTGKVDGSTVDDGVRCFQNGSMSESCAQVRQHLGCLLPESETTSLAEALAQRRNSKLLVAQSNLSNYDTVEERLDALESSSLVNKEKVVEQKAVESNKLDELCSSNKESREPSKGSLRSSKRTVTKTAIDWDSLRRQACCNGSPKERSHDAMDSLDYEAVRCADVNEISDSIRARGMNNMLAERMKDFLNRLVRDHGSLDLEWLRDVPPDKAKDYLLSIRGLGLKSVECVRLLTLHHLAFPVDTNVGRICVRLGWVPLQPLPESLQLHLLELYPVLESIQKYLWPRLCKLDQRTLYELHYQMITFGKVFCTKSRPNCNACPMRAECRHFASAFASARLALPGPEEKSLVTSAVPLTNSDRNHKLVTNETPLPLLEKAPHSQVEFGTTRCEPIIEEPASPEPENFDTSESAIEDAFWEQDPDEIPTIKLNFKEFSQNLQNYMQENHIQLHDVEMSKALVAITPEAASIPMPKLKNVSRLRTEHLVYELPDSHILLKGLDPREPDDPSPYLLAIWTPGETAQSIQPPEMSCNTSESGSLCDKNTCFACNSIREADAQTVRGTLLIPCRTAMRGSFPLNGTYFQVNEVFADHDSSLQPIDVPRAWIWNLPRRTVYFGTSVPTIFRGLTTEGIQHCFWRGFVCVRGFDQKTRAPRPLMARLHFPASKLARAKKSPNKPPE